MSRNLDFEYIRRSIPIQGIAEALGLRISGKMVRCWRPERHKNEDRTPSVGLNIRANTARCFVCDSRSLSTIDLVMSIRSIDILPAARWIAAHFQVPSLPKGKHLATHSRWPENFRVGTRDSRLEVLVRSGIWALLTPKQHSILPVLDTFTPANEGMVTISYRGIARYAGVGSHSTIASALRRFQSFHFLQKRHRFEEAGFRGCNAYRWTLDNPNFVEIAKSHQEKHRLEIEAERTLRAEARTLRKSAAATSKYFVQPV